MSLRTYIVAGGQFLNSWNWVQQDLIGSDRAHRGR